MPRQEPTSWWERNWKWFVPVGCAGFLGVFLLFGMAVLLLVAGGIRSSGAYTDAVDAARSHAAVVEALGNPIETGWFTSGSISVSGGAGEAELSIPLRGPKNRGTLYVIANKRAGRWDFEVLEVQVAGDRIDLLEPRASSEI